MWIFTVFGFYSVIEHRDDKKLVLIRARIKGDLERLRDRYFKTEKGEVRLGEITCTPAADYPYRALAWKDEFAQAMMHMAEDVNYTNFKSAVSKESSWERHDLYMKVWSIMKGAESILRDLRKRGKYTSFSDSQGSLWDNVKDMVPLLGSGKKKSKKRHYDIDVGAADRLDREAAVKARNQRLADHGSVKLKEGLQEEDEASRKARHVEEIARKQLKGTRDDFDLPDGTEDDLEHDPDSWQGFGVGMNPEDFEGMHIEPSDVGLVEGDVIDAEVVKKH